MEGKSPIVLGFSFLLNRFYVKHKRAGCSHQFSPLYQQKDKTRMSYDNHYRIETRTIRGKERTLIIPDNWLKQKQREELEELMTLPVNKYNHGYVHGRSTLTALAPHYGCAAMIKLDLKEFFGSITPKQIFSALRGCRFSEKEASRLIELALYRNKLPFGGVLSPLLSNIVFFPVDIELSRLAHYHNLSYTRYADDLMFSSLTQDIGYDDIVKQVNQTIYRFGFSLNQSKTRYNPKRVLGLPVVYNFPANVLAV